MRAPFRSKHSSLAAALALAVAWLAPAASLASEAGGDAAHVPEHVFHHVTDAPEVSFENPFTGQQLVIGIDPAVTKKMHVNIAGREIDLSPTKHLIFLWIASGLLLGVGFYARAKRSLIPRGFYSVVEVFVKFIRDELAVKNIGKHDADRYVPYLCSIFFFILATNLLGLIPYSATATGNISVTAGLALTSLGMTLYAGMRGQGVVGYWAHLVPGGVPWWLYPIMVPIELLGIFAKPFALAVRLFANMVAGHIVVFFLLGLIFILGQGVASKLAIAPVSVLFAIAIYFLEIFVAFLQAYIFTMLTALFIGLSSHAH